MEKISIKEMLTGVTDAQIKATKIKYQISKALHEKRKQMNMSQKDFAKFMKVSQSMVSKWESFGYNFTIESLCEILQKAAVDFSFEIKKDVQNYAEMAKSTSKNPYKNGLIWSVGNSNMVGKAG